MLRTRAQSMVEYAVLVAAIAAMVIIVAALFGPAIQTLIEDALASL